MERAVLIDLPMPPIYAVKVVEGKDRERRSGRKARY